MAVSVSSSSYYVHCAHKTVAFYSENSKANMFFKLRVTVKR